MQIEMAILGQARLREICWCRPILPLEVGSRNRTSHHFGTSMNSYWPLDAGK
jgi:hypothetical protein